MIEQATERRLAGDWRGACAAAGVDVAFDLADVSREHGGEVTAALEDDLRHFAPDLLRWHLPRVAERGRTTITPSQQVVLGRPAGGPWRKGAPQLSVATPAWMVNGPQRLRLNFAPIDRSWVSLETDWSFCAFWRNVVQTWAASRHLWDARHASELLERCGGNKTRAPFYNSDGTPRTVDQLPGTDPGPGDPATHTEWVTTLHERGEVEAAFAAAGIELDASPFDLDPWYSVKRVEPLEFLSRMPLALTRLEPEIRRLADENIWDRFWIPCTQYTAVVLESAGSDAGLRVEVVKYEMGSDPENAEVLPEACWRRLPDLDLLRDGRTPPEHLHPLVRDALFPGRPAAEGPVGPPDVEPPSSVRVRCRGEWHEVSSRDGALHLPHTDEEQQREHAMRALGGAVAGCFAVQQAWTSGTGRLPKSLRHQRRELFDRIQHGDTPGVLRLLDAGIDPHVRGGRQRTLLHALHLLDHEPLLPRLLAAGLDIDAGDQEQRTPLFVAICERGSVALVRALLAAGARIDVTGEIHGEGMSLYRLIDWSQRTDLDCLTERIEREHPELAEEE